MIPIRLELSGFLSYRAPVELDFRGFTLACISGSNGAGKSSLLDAITWALFGQARGRDDSVVNTNELVERAEVKFEFQYENNRYLVQRIKPKNKTESLYFFIALPDESSPTTWKSLTEKSVSATEARIRETLRMDYETFINASFFLQGKADQFAQQRPGERKRILSNILGLDIWEAYRQRAADRRKMAENSLLEVHTRITEIDNELDEEQARKQKLAELSASLEETSHRRADQEGMVETARKLEATLSEQRKLVDALQRQVQAGEAALDQLSQELNRRKKEQFEYEAVLADAAQVEAEYAAWQAARAELEQLEELAARDRLLDSRQKEALTEIATARSALDQEIQGLSRQKQAIEQIQAQLPEKRRLFASLREKSEAEAGLLELQKSLLDEKSTITEKLGQIRAENSRLNEEMKKLNDRLQRLEAIEGGQCPLCGQPLTAEHRQQMAAEMRNQGKEMGDQFRSNQEVAHQLEDRLAFITREQERISGGLAQTHQAALQAAALESQIGQLEKQVEDWEKTSLLRLRQIEELLAAESYAAESRENLRAVDGQRKALGYDPAAHDQARKREATGRAAEVRLRELETARGALIPLKSTLVNLETQIAQKKGEVEQQQSEASQAEMALKEASTGLPDIQEAERVLRSLKEAENRIRMEVGAARQKVDVLASLKLRRRQLAEQVEQQNELIARLKKLEKAFGKDGVPALLIEQALPDIENEANALLDRLSNGSMSVRFDTQKKYKDKKREDLRETLDILISDSAGTRDYELFSGGEAFRVNFAIRLALSRVLAQRAGARLQTLVIDEGFGSQDAEGRQRLVETINEVKDDFEKILVITHLEELKDAFPTRIEVEKTEQGSAVSIVG